MKEMVEMDRNTPCLTKATWTETEVIDCDVRPFEHVCSRSFRIHLGDRKEQDLDVEDNRNRTVRS